MAHWSRLNEKKQKPEPIQNNLGAAKNMQLPFRLLENNKNFKKF